MNQLKIEYIPIEDLKPYKNNARKHEAADLKTIENSIKEFGMCDPIGIWGDNVIVEGHGRMLALKKLGHENAPCIRLDHLSDEQRRAYALAHNKTAEMSAWDFEMLDIELENILDIEMESFGFIIEDLPEEFELESEKEKKGNVKVSLNIPTVSDWNMVEDEIKRIASEIDATVAVKLE